MNFMEIGFEDWRWMGLRVSIFVVIGVEPSCSPVLVLIGLIWWVIMQLITEAGDAMCGTCSTHGEISLQYFSR
jgi:hypothetical protein